MAKLELFLLGTPQIYVDGQAVTGFNTRKDQALLAYLAVTGTTHSRETLAGLFWPDLPEENARRNLRHSLSHLQKVIGPHWLETERRVALTQDQSWSVDVRTLRATVHKLTASPPPEASHSDTPDVDAVNQVLQLYRGEFLQGFYLHQAVHFEEWVLAQREELRLLTMRWLEAAAQRHLAQGAYEPGLTVTRRLLQLEPWSEPAHCLQMQLLAQSGRRAEALAQYEHCRQILVAELDVEPLLATTALYRQIKAGNYYAPLAPRQPSHPRPLQSADAQSEKTIPRATAVSASEPIPHNLITPLAGFVGRQHELDLIQQRLGAGDCRLLTIVGPGGMGKSTLALEVGQRLLCSAPKGHPADFPDGIFFVPLLDIRAADRDRSEPALDNNPVAGEAILRAIAAQIGAPLEVGVAPDVQLQAYLRTRRLLLILDNFEHLLAGTDAIVTLLSKAPEIKALITSRARLNVRGESVLPLDKLSLPTAAYDDAVVAAQTNPTDAIQADVWQASEAVAMFVQRAQQLDPFFTVSAATLGPIGQICQLVEGLPLGIELATSMLPLLNCTSLAAALASSLDVLAAETRDLPSEQRTLGAVFERSWHLLPLEAQHLLARLAIFPGSFRRDAAEQIAGASITLLRRLLDQSLLNKVGDDRYVMHRTVHAFAQQKLQQWPEQSATLQRQYAHFYLAFLARLEPALTGEASVTAIEQIQADLDNVRTAWRWSVEQDNLSLLEISVGSLQDFYQMAGSYAEAIQLLEAALPAVRHAVALAPAAPQPMRLLAHVLCYTARFYRLYPQLGQVKTAETCAQEAVELGRRLADPALQGQAYHELARQAQWRRDFAAMRLLAEQGCIHGRQAHLPQITAESLNDLGVVVGIITHPLAAIPHFHEALDCLKEQPNRSLEVRLLGNLGLFHLLGHEYHVAYRYMQQADSLQRRLPYRENGLLTLVYLGDLWVALGDYSAAQEVYTQGLALVQARRARYWESWLHASYGRLQHLRGDPAAAQSACRLALQIAQKDGLHVVEHLALIYLGYALADLGDLVAVAHCYHQAIALDKEVTWLFRLPDAQAGLAALSLTQNDITTALPYAEAALALLEHQGLAAAGEPFMVYWTCVRVFQAANDPRVQTVLATAYQALHEIANQLEDERLRRSFLENVVVNRQLVAAAQAAGIV